jgi:hypothetical protein
MIQNAVIFREKRTFGSTFASGEWKASFREFSRFFTTSDRLLDEGMERSGWEGWGKGEMRRSNVEG